MTVKGSGLVQAEVERRLKIGEGGRYLDRDRQRERALPDLLHRRERDALAIFFSRASSPLAREIRRRRGFS